MSKYTAQDVIGANPGISPGEVAFVLEELNQEPMTPDEFYAMDDPGLIAAMLNPPARDRDGLTNAERKVNAFADERGLPIPFPPK